MRVFVGTGALLALSHGRDQHHLLEWLEVGPDLVGNASSNWLTRFEDQRFSLVRAVSFEVMRLENVTSAFAFHHHFEVAGFELLR